MTKIFSKTGNKSKCFFLFFRIRGTCKHVAALFHHILHTVAKGENISLTSLHQSWDKPSSKLHQPDFIENITIKKLQGDCIIKELISSTHRFSFDPRPPSFRHHKDISSYDLDSLADTSGQSAILLYAPRQPHPDFISPHLDNVWHEEVTTTTHDDHLNIPSLPQLASDIKTSHPRLSLQEFHCHLMSRLSINPSQSSYIQHQTIDQHNSPVWMHMRVGRISASKMGECVGKIRDGEVAGATFSVLQDIMGYRDFFSSAATSWGLFNEQAACDSFVNFAKQTHSGLFIHDCGLFISTMSPFICGTPDRLVSCSCHPGLRPLEVKNPWTHRGLTITDYAKERDACLQINDAGFISLKRSHPYYFQVQTQIFLTDSDLGYFSVKTASLVDNFFVEEICFDPEFMESVILRASIFFSKAVVPELFECSVYHQVSHKLVSSLLDDIASRVTSVCVSDDLFSDDITDSSVSSSCSSVEDLDPDCLFPCGVCKQNCPDIPLVDKDKSVGCDACSKWFHFHCVNLSRAPCKKSNWFCFDCKSKKKTF